MSRKIEYLTIYNNDLIKADSLNEAITDACAVFTDLEIALQEKETDQTILMLIVLK